MTVRRSARFFGALCAAVMAVNSAAMSVFAECGQLPPIFSEPDDSALYWATQVGWDKETWSDAPSGLTVGDNGYLYICSADNIYKLNKLTGEIAGSGKMSGQATYASKGPLYVEGRVYMALDNGTVEAFDANTLSSLWVYHNKLGGSPTCDIVYDGGEIFTGFWNGEEEDADYVCIKAADDVDIADGEKSAVWEYTNKGGFYWTAAAFKDNYAILGLENGRKGPLYDGSSNRLLVLDRRDGREDNRVGWAKEDIRSNVVLSDGVAYYTDRNGDLSTYDDLGAMIFFTSTVLGAKNVTCTSTPIVVGNRVYFTLNGAGWDTYNGSMIVVVEVRKEEGYVKGMDVAYTVETAAPCQAKGIFAGVDEDGYNVIYYVENGYPGNIRVLRDREGMTEPLTVSEEADGEGVLHKCAPVIFTPQGEHANYCAIDPVFDPETGLIYVRNDSFNVLAIGTAMSGFDFDSPKNTIHPKGVKTLVYKAGESVSDYEHTVTVGECAAAEEDIVYSIDEFSADDELLTVSYSYGLYTGSGKKATLSEDIDLLVAETDDQYARALANRGDINGDGKIDFSDITLLAAHVKGVKTVDKYSLNAADVNADGRENVTDITELAAHVKGVQKITAER